MVNREKFVAPPRPREEAPPPASYAGPTDFVSLPSKGKFYSSQHPLHDVTEVQVKFMTTKEEDILSSPSYNKKGIVFDKLVESICVDKKIKADALLLGDKNAIIINARKNAYGENYEVEAACTFCYGVQAVNIDLDELKNKEVDYSQYDFTDNGTFVVELPKTKKKVELKLLTGEDEKQIEKRAEQKAKHGLPEETISDRYRQMVVTVDGENDLFTINNFIATLPILDSRYLRKRYEELTPDVNFTFKYSCDHCNEENEGGVPITGNFFWPDI